GRFAIAANPSTSPSDCRSDRVAHTSVIHYLHCADHNSFKYNIGDQANMTPRIKYYKDERQMLVGKDFEGEEIAMKCFVDAEAGTIISRFYFAETNIDRFGVEDIDTSRGHRGRTQTRRTIAKADCKTKVPKLEATSIKEQSKDASKPTKKPKTSD
ncbi:hypothetical protein BCR34DRAFT_639110, partial [Clohesyomyces aquaticus]